MGRTTFSSVVALAVAGMLLAANAMPMEARRGDPIVPVAATARTERDGQQDPKTRDEVDKLRAQLAQPGPEGADVRGSAIEQLLSMVDESAHAVLRDRLANPDDLDGVRLGVLRAIGRRILIASDPVFGSEERNVEARARLLPAYAASLTIFWQGEVDAGGQLPPDPLRSAARYVLLRMPQMRVEEGLRQVAGDGEQPLLRRIAALRAASDMQSLSFGRLIADFLTAEPRELAQAARTGLRLLTFSDRAFESREQFEAWMKELESSRYFDLAEEAARAADRKLRQQAQEMARQQREATAELVRVATDRRGGIDWAFVATRTFGSDRATTKACLQQLRRTLETLGADDVAPARAAFARQLFQGYQRTDPAEVELRALQLEVAAYLFRSSETEAVEVGTELVEQLEIAGTSPPAPVQPEPMILAALRALRRYPSPDARIAVVRIGTWALAQGEQGDAVLAQSLQTLGDRTEPSWRAPVADAPDKEPWLQFLRDVCNGQVGRDRRREALAVMQLQDRANNRPAGVFELLLAIVRDGRQESEFRIHCLVELQNWIGQEDRADAWVRLLTGLLGDGDRYVRKEAAEALAKLPPASEERRKGWIRSILAELAERMPVEADDGVLTAMRECLKACGRETGATENVIGLILRLLERATVPVPPEQQVRVNEYLAALTAVAADSRAVEGQWIPACRALLQYERRPSARHVLEQHNAVLLATQVKSTEAAQADLARAAMRCLLHAALLKPVREGWQSTPELQREALDVVQAFDALASLPAADIGEQIEQPRFRLLRLEVLVATGGTKQAQALAKTWLEEVDPKDHAPLDAAQRDQVRLLAAEALMLERAPAEAERMLAQVDPARRSVPRAIEVAERIAKAYLVLQPPQPARAAALLDQVVQATAEDAPSWRPRFLAWLDARLLANPAERAAVLQALDQKWKLFEAADCPEDLRNRAQGLRGSRSNG